ncbi:EGF-like domain [Trinorchestia longiramus]|nr:EGF-like domain [Trinorchestia longiramus]
MSHHPPALMNTGAAACGRQTSVYEAAVLRDRGGRVARVAVQQRKHCALQHVRHSLPSTRGFYGNLRHSLPSTRRLYDNLRNILPSTRGFYGNLRHSLPSTRGLYGNLRHSLPSTRRLYDNLRHSLPSTRRLYGNLCHSLPSTPKCVVPCINGGVCRGDNKCRCPPGFGGSHCEIAQQTSAVRLQRCRERCVHGRCHDVTGVCKCDDNHSGRWCRRRTRGRRRRIWV